METIGIIGLYRGDGVFKVPIEMSKTMALHPEEHSLTWGPVVFFL